MKIALCQINQTVGDFRGNRRRIEAAAARARTGGAQLAVFPELAVCGYPAEDLLLRAGFLDAHDAALNKLAANLPPDLCVIVGCLERNTRAGWRGERPIYNAAALIEDGIPRIVARKSLLPTYDVFDEMRYFQPFAKPEKNVVSFGGVKFGITICEDAWNDAEFFKTKSYAVDPVECVVGAGAEVLINISASPWNRLHSAGPCDPDVEGKEGARHAMLEALCTRHDRRLIFVNQVGGDVGIQFDGGSMALGPEGVAAAPVYFDEHVQIVDTKSRWGEQFPRECLSKMQHGAVCQGIADYSAKFGLGGAVVGLSGGIDSAVTATLAVDALGADRVTGIAMPSHHSSEHSVRDALALAENLGIVCHRIGIAGLQDAFSTALGEVFAGTEPGVAEENLQARARGAILMAYANKFGGLVLTTGNKSETAVGYATLYGDMNGALAPIADLWKVEVYALARWLNRDGGRIPASSIEKPPSAELRPDQLDTDSLPPYDELDPVLCLLVEHDLPVADVAERTGMPRDRVTELFRMVQASEFKRFQYAPVVRVSGRCWGGRRMPVSHAFLRE